MLDDDESSGSGKDDVFLALRDSALEVKLETEINQLSEKSRRLLRDLGTLRVLLHQMEELDPVSFFQSLELLKNNEKVKRSIYPRAQTPFMWVVVPRGPLYPQFFGAKPLFLGKGFCDLGDQKNF